ncbi:MAG: hypothetical protein JXR73_00680 [Candidatus Omnitrophica bacterium]|nr:hypothetical protein [Candidatus Omnitrophota bacterium]
MIGLIRRMRMIPRIFFQCLAGFVLALFVDRIVYAHPPNELERVPALSLNGEWIVYIADSEEPVVESAHLGIDSPFSNPVKMDIPGHFQLQLEEIQKPSASLFNEYYRRNFRLPASWQNRRILLRFDGVLSPYEVWIDGKRVGRCDFPMGRAEFDITDALSSEKNHAAAVKVLTSETPDLRPLTGIFRDVTLLALPNRSIEKILATPEIDAAAGDAKLHIEVALSHIPPATGEEDVSVSLELFTPYGESVAQTTITWFEEKEGNLTGRAILPADNLKTWTAETPVLHRLTAELKAGDQPAHRTSVLVGIRRIETRRGVLAVNGKPVHLRGILYRESHPQAGWALREDQWIADLRRMKEANINAIRLAARPPHPRFLELCDEMGFYVIPDLHLPDAADLRDKALRSIIERNFNHPCILAWSLGDCSSWSEALEESAERIHALDSSRPLLAAGLFDPTLSNRIDILAPRYPTQSELKKILRQKRPVIVAAHTPAVDGALEGLEELQRWIYEEPALSGGMLEQFADDRWASGERAGSAPCGILNEDRTPQMDFWQLQRVYSPLRIEEREARIKSGRQTIELHVDNQYDFTNLRELSGSWILQRDNQPILSRSLLLDLQPGKSMQTAAMVEIPDDLDEHDYSLRYQFAEKTGRAVYEHVVRLRPGDWEKDFLSRLSDLHWDKNWRATAGPLRAQIEHRNYSFIIQLASAEWFMRTQEHNVRLITGGPYIRLNRSKPSAASASEDETPALLRDLWVDYKEVDKLDKNNELRTHVMDAKSGPDNPAAQAQIDILSSPFGFNDIRFSIRLRDDQTAGELGLAFLAPPTLSEIVWMGDGPYPSYPGVSALNDWGIFSFKPIDRIVPGNRMRVNLLALRDERGYGLGVMALDGRISIEPVKEGSLITVNCATAGVGSRTQPTLHPISEKERSGASFTAFRLIPLTRNQHPSLFARLWADQ